MSEKHNYRVTLLVDNFRTDSDELVFDDFKIMAIRQGREAAEWRRKMHCKRVPEYILVKDFLDYSTTEDDSSGFDLIMNESMNLLLAFRLFKLGDLFFNDMMIEDLDSEDGSFSLFRMDNISAHKYELNQEYAARFNDFKSKTIPKLRNRRKYIEYPLGQFLQGGNKAFQYRKEATSRIVDYVVALESIFLVDSHHWFLRRTLSSRIAAFLSNQEAGKMVKFMYDERSKIVHGNYIDLDDSGEKKLIDNLKKYMVPFEGLMRMVFNKVLDLEFSSREEIKKYMESLYRLPEEVIQIMNSAKAESDKKLATVE